MKRLFFFSSLLVVAMVVLVSCSKDDNPKPTPEQASFDVVFSGIKVDANYQNVTPPNQTKQLADVLSSANKDKASSVKGGSIQYNDSYVAIQGLNAGQSLNSVAINLMNGQSVSATFNMGKVSATADGSPLKISSNDCMTFLNSVTSTLVSKKNITLQVVLNGGDTDITNLTITVHATAIFSW